MKVAIEFWLSDPADYLKRHAQSLRAFSLRDILYLAILFFIPTQFGKHFWPPFSSVAGIRIDYLSPTLYVTDVLLATLFIFMCYDLVVKKKTTSYVSRVLSFLLHKPFFFTGIAALVVGAILAPSPPLSFYGLFRIGELAFFALCTKRFLEASSSKQRLFSMILLTAILFESCLAIAQFLTQHSVGGALYLFGERKMAPDVPGAALAALNGELILRPYGTFSHPNVLAGFLIISGSIIGSISSLQKKTSQVYRSFILFVLFIATVTIFLTLSRIVIVLLCFTLLLFGLLVVRKITSQRSSLSRYKLRTRRNLLRWLLVLIAFFILIFYISPLFLDRFSSPDFLGESFRERLLLATTSVEMIFNNPFYGMGLGQYIPTLPQYLPSLHFSLLQPAHSIFLLLLAESGVLSFFGVISIIFHGVKKQLSGGVSMLIIPLAFSILLGLGDHYLLTQQQGRLMLGVVLGVLFVSNGRFAHRLMKNTKKG